MGRLGWTAPEPPTRRTSRASFLRGWTSTRSPSPSPGPSKRCTACAVTRRGCSAHLSSASPTPASTPLDLPAHEETQQDLLRLPPRGLRDYAGSGRGQRVRHLRRLPRRRAAARGANRRDGDALPRRLPGHLPPQLRLPHERAPRPEAAPEDRSAVLAARPSSYEISALSKRTDISVEVLRRRPPGPPTGAGPR